MISWLPPWPAQPIVSVMPSPNVQRSTVYTCCSGNIYCIANIHKISGITYNCTAVFRISKCGITGERNIGARHVQSGCFVLVSLTKIWDLKPSIRCADCLLCMLLHPLFPPHNVFAACLISAIGNPKAGTSKHDSMPFLPLMPLDCPRSEEREQPKITITKFCQEYSPTTSRLQFTVYRYIATAIYNRFYAFVCRLNDGRIVICKRNTQFCRLISVQIDGFGTGCSGCNCRVFHSAHGRILICILCAVPQQQRCQRHIVTTSPVSVHVNFALIRTLYRIRSR